MQIVNNLFSNFSDKQINYNDLNELLNHDCMYKTRWSLFQVLHTTLHCVKTIQKVCRPVSDFLQVGLPRGRSDKTISSSKTIG